MNNYGVFWSKGQSNISFHKIISFNYNVFIDFWGDLRLGNLSNFSFSKALFVYAFIDVFRVWTAINFIIARNPYLS